MQAANTTGTFFSGSSLHAGLETVLREDLPSGPSHDSWPFMGRLPNCVSVGGVPFLHASSSSTVVFGVKHS